ncbi:hypothetical protein J6590_108315 [Homalodisca vitripennis]|nr:hypothetical protein J6590_108315 [Homalodisca vitripennis]
MFIYPRRRMSPLLERGGPAGSVYTCSHNGWSNENIFLDWLKHFNKIAKPSQEDPVLLILDNHGSHVSLPSYEFCRQNHIHMLSIPPHTSHRLQPLDVSFYGPLKNVFNRECDKYMRSSTYRKITPYDIATIFNEAYVTVATIDKGVSGFRSTGIYPVNRDTFKEEDFFSVQSLEPIVIDDQEDMDANLQDQETYMNKTITQRRPMTNPMKGIPIYDVDGLPGVPCSSGSTVKADSSQSKHENNIFSKALEKFSPIPNYAAGKIKTKCKEKKPFFHSYWNSNEGRIGKNSSQKERKRI